MTPLKNKIVFITGASSGIGEACAREAAALGARLILTARRLDRIQALAQELRETHDVEVLPLALDVRNKKEVFACISGLEKSWQAIDILVNNAGLALGLQKLQEGAPDDWDTMIQTNLNGLLYVTRAVLPLMLAHQAGHIVNIGSVAGRQSYVGGNVYAATKAAVHSLCSSLRLDLLGTDLRVTEISPGMVETEFSQVRLKDEAKAKAVYAGLTPLSGIDIADAVMYCVTRPSHVNIAEMVVYPTAQAAVGQIAKRK